MLLVLLAEPGSQGPLGFSLAMHDPYIRRPILHPRHELHQPLLARMRRVPADAGYLRADVEAFAVQVHVAAPRAVLLDGVAGGAAGLVADKESIVPWIVQHGLEVIDDAPTRAHAVACNDDGRARGLGEVVHHGDMVGVAVDGDQVVEGQRVTAGFDAFAGLLVPIRLQAAVGLGEASRQGRVEDDRQRGPGCQRWRAGAAFGSGRRRCAELCIVMDDFFQLVEQLLRTADAERGNQYRAFVLQGVLDNGLEALPA